jgi:cytochrome c oxidase assembly protein subunit 15
VNPPGWTEEKAKLLEHSHRLVATLTSITTAVLCSALWRNWLALAIGPLCGVLGGFIAWKCGATGAVASAVGIVVNVLGYSAVLISRRGERSGEQKLVFAAAWLVSVQAILGGLRVLIEAHVSPEAAIGFRVFHGIVAQAFLVLVVIIAARLSPVWRELSATPNENAGKFRRMAVVLLGLYFVQLACAAYLRHKGIGMLIPTWPAAGANGSLLPVAWSHEIGIHFLHSRILPILIAGHIIGMAIGTAKRAAGVPRLTRVGWALLALVLVQIMLGVMVIWKVRHAHITNTHVLTGAVLCATAALYFARAGRLRAA